MLSSINSPSSIHFREILSRATRDDFTLRVDTQDFSSRFCPPPLVTTNLQRQRRFISTAEHHSDIPRAGASHHHDHRVADVVRQTTVVLVPLERKGRPTRASLHPSGETEQRAATLDHFQRSRVERFRRHPQRWHRLRRRRGLAEERVDQLGVSGDPVVRSRAQIRSVDSIATGPCLSGSRSSGTRRIAPFPRGR